MPATDSVDAIREMPNLTEETGWGSSLDSTAETTTVLSNRFCVKWICLWVYGADALDVADN
jgi:hypothetical protein